MTFFKPWVGKYYFRKELFPKKIMVLGESHYCASGCSDCGIANQHPECSNFTKNVIGWYLDHSVEREGWMNTYLKFERSLIGRETTIEDSYQIWHSLVFYNYLQIAMHGPRKSGTNTEYYDASTTFYETLKNNRPDILIVWGVRLLNYLPNIGWKEGAQIEIEGYQVLNGYYYLPDGHVVRSVGVYHPSVGYDWGFWHKVIRRFIEEH